MGPMVNRGGGQGVDRSFRASACRLAAPGLRSSPCPGHMGPWAAVGRAWWVSLVPGWVSQGWGPQEGLSQAARDS